MTGTVFEIRLNRIILLVNGIGYEVIVAPDIASESKVGGELSLHTSLVVREDSWSLYGFLSQSAKSLFEELQSVTGIGPKVASALLAVYGPDALRNIIASQDNEALERVLLELKEKFGASYKSKSALSGPWRTQVIGALTGLGYSQKEAESALDKVLESYGRTPTSEDTPEMLKLALAQSRQKR